MTPAMISACEAHILSHMAAEHSTVPVIMSGQAVPANERMYVRFWVIPSTETFQTAITPTSRSRNVGIIQADVYGPKDEGAGPTGNIATSIGKAFHRVPIEILGEGWTVFKDASVKDMGDVDEEHRQMVRVPYRFDFEFNT